MLNWSKIPASIANAISFVHSTNSARGLGIEIDTAQLLANKIACLCVREYFSRLLSSVVAGELDPMSLDEWKELASDVGDSSEETES